RLEQGRVRENPDVGLLIPLLLISARMKERTLYRDAQRVLPLAARCRDRSACPYRLFHRRKVIAHGWAVSALNECVPPPELCSSNAVLLEQPYNVLAETMRGDGVPDCALEFPGLDVLGDHLCRDPGLADAGHGGDGVNQLFRNVVEVKHKQAETALRLRRY